MSDRAALLAAVAANPHDDLPKLVFADWLDEHGDPERAEFIRTQLAGDEERADELLRGHGDRWAAPFPARRGTFRRGFLVGLSLDGDEFLQHAPAIDRLRTVERVELRAQARHAAELAACPQLRLVRQLELCDPALGEDGLRHLAASQHLGPLERLNLVHCGLTAVAVPLLGGMASDRLWMLDLGGNHLGDTGAALLCACPKLTGVADLNLRSTEIGPPTADALAASPWLRSLRWLDLGTNYLDDDAVATLANAGNLANLESLDLSYNEFGMEGYRALAASPVLTKLALLDVTANGGGIEGYYLLRDRFGIAVHD